MKPESSLAMVKKDPDLWYSFDFRNSTQDRNLRKLWWARIHDATHHVSLQLAHCFWWRFFKDFYHIWAWWSSWSCDSHSPTNFCFPISWNLHMKFGFNRPSGFRGEDVWKCWQRRTTDALLYFKLNYEPQGNYCTKFTFYFYRNLWHISVCV